MNTFRTFVISAVAGATIVSAAPAQAPPPADRAARDDFARRMYAYVALKESVQQTVLPLVTLSDPTEIRRRTDALATVIKSARSTARQGDLFTPPTADLIRRLIRDGCEGDYAMLLALIREEYSGPLQAPVIHGRWPALVPIPTMLPGLLAALPPLPSDL